jgi:hypothetical protein
MSSWTLIALLVWLVTLEVRAWMLARVLKRTLEALEALGEDLDRASVTARARRDPVWKSVPTSLGKRPN